MSDDLERILSSDDDLEPSSGFARSVLEAARTLGVEPPPIPFPWRRFAVGLAACLCLAGAGAALWEDAVPALAPLVARLAPFAASGRDLAYGMLAVVGSLLIARAPRVLSRR